MEKKVSGHQFLISQLATAHATIAQLLDELAMLQKRLEQSDVDRTLPEGVTRMPQHTG